MCCGPRARSQRRFVPPLIHFIPDSLRDSVPLFPRRQCDRTLGVPDQTDALTRATRRAGRILRACSQLAASKGGRRASHGRVPACTMLWLLMLKLW
jgi:hypothetical protein